MSFQNKRIFVNIYRENQYAIAILISFLLLSGCVLSDSDHPSPEAFHGVLDLSRWDLVSNGPIDLTGQWEFYWQEHIDHDSTQSMTGFIDLPGSWKSYSVNGQELPLEGYGSYRLKVILPETRDKTQQLGFRFANRTNPLTVFVNGSVVSQIGVVGKRLEDTVYDSVPHIVDFFVEDDEFEIIVHVSNFRWRKDAGTRAIQLGMEKDLRDARQNTLFVDFLVFGMICFVGLGCMTLFFANGRRDAAVLYLGLICVAMFVRSLLMREWYFNHLFPNASWETESRLLIFSFCMITLSFAFLVYTLFPSRALQPLFRIVLTVYIVILGAVFFAPVWVLAYAQYLHSFSAAVAGTICVGILLLEFKRKREGVGIFLVGSVFLSIAGMHDVIINNFLIARLDYLSHFGILIFIFSQIYLVGRDYYRSVDKIDILSKKLDEKEVEILKLRNKGLDVSEPEINHFVEQYNITNREKQIVVLILQGQTNREIANSLYISFFTVRKHINNIYEKVNIQTRDQIFQLFI